ncbi:MAG: hypothetical protein Ct9H90mP16_18440 [Candidatus Poseidoniales archaeon]|nr:MAG: hypothetical protein Ct9H90mP16_18440 [Candidatus Poseidoniales archaeon]
MRDDATGHSSYVASHGSVLQMLRKTPTLIGQLLLGLYALRWIGTQHSLHGMNHLIPSSIDVLGFAPQTVPTSILAIRLISVLLPWLLPEPVKLHVDFRLTAWPQVHPLHHAVPTLKPLKSIFGFAIVDVDLGFQFSRRIFQTQILPVNDVTKSAFFRSVPWQFKQQHHYVPMMIPTVGSCKIIVNQIPAARPARSDTSLDIPIGFSDTGPI